MEDLQEAYLAIYEANKADEFVTSNMYTADKDIKNAKIRRRQGRDFRGVLNPADYSQGEPVRQKAHRDRRGVRKEEIDSYDLVLDYLLDEGYADSEDNAITIMANMSEEWIDDILDEAVLGARKGHIRSVVGKGGSIKYVASGGDIVANDRSAQARASAAERERAGKNKVRTAQFQQANKTSIQRLNAKPGADSGDYDSGYHGDDDTSDGDRHYSLSRTSRSARTRRARG